MSAARIGVNGFMAALVLYLASAAVLNNQCMVAIEYCKVLHRVGCRQALSLKTKHMNHEPLPSVFDLHPDMRT